jgi:hypothetical protein
VELASYLSNISSYIVLQRASYNFSGQFREALNEGSRDNYANWLVTD